MSRSAYRIAGATLFAGLFFAAAAQAQDGALTAPHDLYFNGTIGGSVLHFSGSSNVASTYYGLDGSAEVCGATAAGFDVCGGLNGFHSLGGGKTSVTVGAASFSTKTRIAAIGGFIKARKQMDQVGVAPYLGLRRLMTKTDVTGAGAPVTIKDDGNSVYGGVELDYSLVENRVYLSMKAELGRTFGAQTNRTTVLFSPGVKVRF